MPRRRESAGTWLVRHVRQCHSRDWPSCPPFKAFTPSRPSAGAITSACWRCSDQAARTTAFSRFAGRDHAPDVRGMQQADVMVLHDWIWLASTQPVQSCQLPPLCLLRQFVAGLRVASARSSEGSPATINTRSVIHGVAHVLRPGCQAVNCPTGADSRCSSADAIGSRRWKPANHL